MDKLFNQYSFILFAAALFLVIAALVLARSKSHWQDLLPLGVIAASLVVAWFALHPVQTPLMESSKKVQALIGQGQPVLLEFQSPY